MNVLKKISPADYITLSNGLMGFLAILYFFDGGDRAYIIGTTLIFLAMLADGLDGYVARRTKTKHHYGVYLDSMSDTVSFCFAPAILIYANFYDVGAGSALLLQDLTNVLTMIASSAVFLLGVIRLAQFSVLGEDELNHFEGIATPAMTYFIVLFVMLFHEWGEFDNFVLVSIIAISALMLSEFRYPKIRGNVIPVSLVALSTAVIASLTQFMDTELKYIPIGISFLLVALYFLYPVVEYLGLVKPMEKGGQKEESVEESREKEKLPTVAAPQGTGSTLEEKSQAPAEVESKDAGDTQETGEPVEKEVPPS